MYKYCMSVKKRPLPEITHFFLTIVAQLRNCSIVHFILETDMAKKCRSSKLQFDSIFCIFAQALFAFLQNFSVFIHSKFEKFRAQASTQPTDPLSIFQKTLFGDIVMISLIYLGKIKISQKTKALSTLISNQGSILRGCTPSDEENIFNLLAEKNKVPSLRSQIENRS